MDEKNKNLDVDDKHVFVTFRAEKGLLKHLDQAVERGEGANRSEVIRRRIEAFEIVFPEVQKAFADFFQPFLENPYEMALYQIFRGGLLGASPEDKERWAAHFARGVAGTTKRGTIFTFDEVREGLLKAMHYYNGKAKQAHLPNVEADVEADVEAMADGFLGMRKSKSLEEFSMWYEHFVSAYPVLKPRSVENKKKLLESPWGEDLRARWNEG